MTASPATGTGRRQASERKVPGAPRAAGGLKLHTIAYGCQMSAADVEEMSRPFAERGFSLTDDLEKADAVLMGTCTIRQHAEDKALSQIGRLREWKARDPNRLLIVAGCAAERLKFSLRRRHPHVDLVVGARSIAQFPEAAAQALRERFDGLAESRQAWASNLLEAQGTAPRPSAVSQFVTVMRGCNYACSYCVVPEVRGPELYRPVADVAREAAERVAAGAREIVLLGQTVNSYRGREGGAELRFSGLLRRLDKTPGLERLRFTSPHPHFLDETLARAMAECPTVCEALHLPVQSGSDRLLKLMRRNYTRDSFLKRLGAARRIIPGLTVTTDVIVGFPSESDEEFEATLSLLDEAAVASAYAFKYSPRPGTAAAAMADSVPPGVKEERLARVNARINRRLEAALEERLGRGVEVLAETPDRGKTREGFAAKLLVRATPGRVIRGVAARRQRLTLVVGPFSKIQEGTVPSDSLESDGETRRFP